MKCIACEKTIEPGTEATVTYPDGRSEVFCPHCIEKLADYDHMLMTLSRALAEARHKTPEAG